ncbi:MAG: exosortase C-terminal domain/associated protein EpsI [Leptospirales bacterium]
MSRKSFNMFLSSAIMLVAFGFLLKSRDEGIIPPHVPLSRFPVQVGEWSGVPIPLSHKEKDILNADGYASVLYTRQQGSPPLQFFSAYYDHQTPEKNIHSPQNCLPSSGWVILHSNTVKLPLYGKSRPPVQVNYDVIQKGLEMQVVLYWYQERGRIFPNEYWGRYYLIRDAILLHRTDGALVRVSMPFTGQAKVALRTETSFIQRVMPLLSSYIPGRAEERLASGQKLSKTFLHSSSSRESAP